jgi:hypothetical protein
MFWERASSMELAYCRQSRQCWADCLPFDHHGRRRCARWPSDLRFAAGCVPVRRLAATAAPRQRIHAGARDPHVIATLAVASLHFDHAHIPHVHPFPAKVNTICKSFLLTSLYDWYIPLHMLPQHAQRPRGYEALNPLFSRVSACLCMVACCREIAWNEGLNALFSGFGKETREQGKTQGKGRQ